MSITELSYNSKTLLLPQINQPLSKLIKPEWFDIEYWREANAITGSSKGRNITWFVGHQNDEWVLRHYYRGGLVAKILGDKYWYSNIENTRAYQELKLLEIMHLQGLPVPKPIAACIDKRGIYYRADILIEKIPYTKDLVAKLSQNSLTEAVWHQIGATIAKFHEAGIYHSDLNAHNILIDNDLNIWLIDFDKCDKRSVELSWQQENLKRLRRSFNKETNLHQTFYFNQQNWQWLIDGYQNFYHLDEKVI